ncbi:glycerate dehydrogenase [Microthyrium microscopicum]|uniref:Glycerate dehydrogenase n=1 Tax=Microthyrium microscopicum TaxID=703497 RepID=A0A6A6TXR0_9PEZI|nr:glycerate dehydrogenase [Microthyrium microscopicum]
MHHHIVVLEGIHMPIPTFPIPAPHTATQTSYPTTSAADLRERILDATIIIGMPTINFTAEILSPSITPKLRFIATLGVGTDNIDLKACEERGIGVSNTPGANTDAVAEHVIALYFAARKSVPQMHNRTMAGEWKASKSLTRYMRDADGVWPITLREEVCGIVGYGAIGKRVAELMKALGMQVIVSGRKGVVVEGESDEIESVDLKNPKRVSFGKLLKVATTLVVVCPKTTETLNLISTEELQAMRRNALVVNVSRGGIVDEAAMTKALNEKQIAGYATDVFDVEPSDQNDTPLLRDLADDANFVASPHVAWFSELTRLNLTRMLTENVQRFLAGEAQQNIIVKGLLGPEK